MGPDTEASHTLKGCDPRDHLRQPNFLMFGAVGKSLHKKLLDGCFHQKLGCVFFYPQIIYICS